MAADGHTEAAFNSPALKGYWLPLHIRRFSDGWFVRTGHPRYLALFGKPITHVGGTTIDVLIERLRPFVSCDNAHDVLVTASLFNVRKNILALDLMSCEEPPCPG